MKEKNKKILSEISPAKIVRIFKNNPILQAKLLLKEFIGLRIGVSGIIESVEDVGMDYVTFNFYNETDNVYISANFDKPVKQDLLVLDRGEKIKISGKIFNATERMVVLDHCKLINKFDQFQPEKIFIDKSPEKIFNKLFWKILIPVVIIVVATYLISWFGIKQF